MTTDKPKDYHAYLLRVWRDDEVSPWRATLQDPHTGHTYGFSTMQQLYHFLEAETESKRKKVKPMAYYLNQQIIQQSTRQYHVYVPDNPLAAQLPTIIVFHGGGQDVEVIAKRWGIDLNPAAPNPPVPPQVQDYMLVFPEADPHLMDEWVHYKAGDSGFPDYDLLFVNTLIAELTTANFPTPAGIDVSANAEKLYAAGFSNGGGMVWQLAYSNLVALFQGFAVVAKALDPEKVSSFAGVPPPVPFIYIHGTADDLFRPPVLQMEASLDVTLPYNTVREMLNRNGIPGGAANTQLIPGSTGVTEVVAQLFLGGNAAFSYVTVINGGHNWPSPTTPGIVNPPVAEHYNATEGIIDFWKNYAGL
jgi:poly(3-hydroxybutyrate) depolymerase